jgi:hypothetical protein
MQKKSSIGLLISALCAITVLLIGLWRFERSQRPTPNSEPRVLHPVASLPTPKLVLPREKISDAGSPVAPADASPIAASLPPAESRPLAATAMPPEDADTTDESDMGFLEDEEIERRITEQGGVLPAYLKATREEREFFLDYLMAEDRLRAELPRLLPVEQDSSLRAYMLERTDPLGYFDSPEDADQPPVMDSELMVLLDSPAPTAMNSDEWAARVELAVQIDDDYGLRWVRRAWESGPDDAELRRLSASLLLNLGASIEGVSPAERERAEAYLYENLTLTDTRADERIRGYQSLFFAPDRARARAFFEQRLSEESDPAARTALEIMLTHW